MLEARTPDAGIGAPPDAGYGAPPDVGRVAARNLREPRLPSGALLRAPFDDGSGMAVGQT